MNKFIITLLLAAPVASFAQKTIYGKIIAGNYWMRDMKQLQDELNGQLAAKGIPAKATLSFPASIQGELGMDFSIYDAVLNEYTVGGFANYMFTEGLITYSDYSGRVDLEQKFRRFSLGVKGAFSLMDYLQMYGKVSYTMTYFDILSRTTLHGVAPVEDKLGFEPRGLAFEAGLQWTKTINRFKFSAHGGYEFNPLISSETYITNDAGDPIQPDWSGFRIGVGAGLLLRDSGM